MADGKLRQELTDDERVERLEKIADRVWSSEKPASRDEFMVRLEQEFCGENLSRDMLLIPDDLYDFLEAACWRYYSQPAATPRPECGLTTAEAVLVNRALDFVWALKADNLFRLAEGMGLPGMDYGKVLADLQKIRDRLPK